MRQRNILIGTGLCLAGVVGVAAFLAAPGALPDLPMLDPAKYPNCVLTPVPANHVLVEATANDGAVLTNILFEPQPGRRPDASAVVHVRVAPGSRPITLVAAGRNTLWEFSGDVQRVKRVVALSVEGDQNVAISGIPDDRVEFLKRGQCPLFANATATTVLGDVRPQQQSLRLMFGRKADSVAWYWKAHTLSLPEGAWSLAPPGAERFRALDPKDFISPVALSVSAVKPARAGLDDYERDGSIRAPRLDEIEKFIEGASARYRSKLTPDYRIRVGFDYVVTRPIQLPVGMFGPKSKRFLVLDGVPPPEGERSHSCIALMDGFRMEQPTMCVGSAGPMMDRLSQWHDPAELEGCRVLAAAHGCFAAGRFGRRAEGGQRPGERQRAFARAGRGPSPKAGRCGAGVELL